MSRHARTAGIDLSPSTIDELAAHLEDLYLAAVQRGADQRSARREALEALEASGLLPLRREPRRDPRASHGRLANDIAATSRFRSLAMIYALRMALRQFRLHPAFAFVTILVLGLGTGAATVVYTIVDSVVLRPLPYRAPDRLVKFWDTNTEKGLRHDPFSPVTFMDYKALPAFADAAAWWRPDVNLVDPGLDPVRVKTIETSGNLFSVLGVGTQVGPGFPAGGPFFSNDLVAVISDRLWRTRYNADPAVVGKLLNLNGTPYRVVGVMPPGFRFPDDVDVWQRLRWDLHSTQPERALHGRGGPAGRRRVARAGARSGRPPSPHVSAPSSPAATRAGPSESCPCSTTSSVTTGRRCTCCSARWACSSSSAASTWRRCCSRGALSREREIAVRTALGATPRQIVTQLLAESFVLSVFGAAAGLLVALVALPVIVAVTPVEVPRLAEAAISGRVLSLALGAGRRS